MKQTLLRKLTLLPLLSVIMFALLCVSSIFLQGSTAVLAASRSSSSVHNQAYSTRQSVRERPGIPNGGTLNCSYLDVPNNLPFYSSPTVVNGIIYVGSVDDNVYALNATTCAQIWNYVPPAGPSRNWIIDTPAVAAVNGAVTVYFGSLDHSVFALDAGLGTVTWTYTTGNYVDSSPTVVNGLLYIGSNDGNLYELTA